MDCRWKGAGGGVVFGIGRGRFCRGGNVVNVSNERKKTLVQFMLPLRDRVNLCVCVCVCVCVRDFLLLLNNNEIAHNVR